MNKILLSLATLLALSVPVQAEVFEFETVPCITKEITTANILNGVPQSAVEFEGDSVMVFSAPIEPLNFRVDFDANGCAYLGTEIDDVSLELLKQGI